MFSNCGIVQPVHYLTCRAERIAPPPSSGLGSETATIFSPSFAPGRSGDHSINSRRVAVADFHSNNVTTTHMFLDGEHSQ